MSNQHYNRKLTAEQVRELRRDKDKICECCGMMPTYLVMARRYGITPAAAHHVHKRHTYKHVE